jgi:hypothetical protein
MNTRLSRFLLGAGTLAVLAVFASAFSPAQARDTASATKMTVFKDPNCGCCKEWVEHLRKHGFEVTSRDTSDVPAVKRTARVPDQLHSCHTAFVNGYVVEGHVPAADVQRMLTEKPRIAGIAVPGMPVGSPGMEMGSRRDRYDVVAFNRDGSTKVFASH